MSKYTTAGLILIGNELLSGRTRDENMNYIAAGLADIGVRFMECRVIPDLQDEIIFAVNEMRAKYDYLFTTGGIGPTHDDITSLAIAKAFGVELTTHSEAALRLKEYYKGRQHMLNESRMKMAQTPEGAKLINNPISAAPGFIQGNVYVMAGVPSIMKVMFDDAKQYLKGGIPVISKTIAGKVLEGDIAEELAALQSEFTDIDIGSYPLILEDGKLSLNVVIRGYEEEQLLVLESKIEALISSKKTFEMD